MAKFVYRMQNILELEEKLEEQAKIDFRLANAALDEEKEKLRELFKRRAGYERDVSEEINGDFDLKEISFLKNAIDIIKTNIRDQMMNIERAQKAVDAARDHLNEVMVDRKTQEKLKEKAFEKFKQELAADENKEVDQLVSFTYRPNS